MSDDQENKKIKTAVTYYEITEGEECQRIDNYLMTKLKKLPKSRIYRLLRKGEVRINKKRVLPSHKLAIGEQIRIPPVFLAEEAHVAPPSKITCDKLTNRIIYEDEFLLILNKPSGMSVHAGSTVRMGVIEIMKHQFPKLSQLELAHRLDSETSGCLILAKKKRILRELHSLLREGKIRKYYWTLTKGRWQPSELQVDVSLHKHYRDGGKHVVEVNASGKSALTVFKTLKSNAYASLMEVKLHTGRTHQIRVHAQHQGHEIAGDDRYGDALFNKLMREKGLKRMFLHARSLEFTLPSINKHIKVTAPLDSDLESFLSVMHFNNEKE